MTIYGAGENDKMDLRVAQPDSTGKQQLDENANQGSACVTLCVCVCVCVCIHLVAKDSEIFELEEKDRPLEEKSPFLPR